MDKAPDQGRAADRDVRARAGDPPPDPWRDLVQGTITAGGRDLGFVHPREVADLVDEKAFETDEYLPYWAQLWPSGVALARAVAARSLDGMNVLEIGCGIGLPSVAAALAAARVLATDWSSDAIDFTNDNAVHNGAVVETAVCSWAEPEVMTARAPWDIVLAADVLYERRNVAWLLSLFPQLVDRTGEIWLADPQRPAADEFLAAAETDWESTTTTDAAFPEVRIHRLWKRGPR